MPDIGMGLLSLYPFGGIVTNSFDFLDLHVWGCPEYVLDPTLQDGKKLPKWSPQKCHGQFLGWSKQHASTVALIQNFRTGSIALQFYMVIDNWFTTVAQMNTDDNFVVPDNWEELFKMSCFNSLLDWGLVEDGYLSELHIEWLPDRESEQH
eukprot:5498478-Ditylum_brightwellii.AAC.1